MVNTVRISANHGRDFNPLTDHMTKLRNFTKGENREFSAFRFSLNFKLDIFKIYLIVCVMISQKLHSKVAQTSQHVAVNTR